MSDRWLIAGGFACLVIAASILFVGIERSPVLFFASLGLGAALLFAALVKTRRRSEREVPASSSSRASWLRITTWVLITLAAATAVAAVVVAVGDARGHAVGHLVTGLACLGLFIALASMWHPDPHSGLGTFRTLALAFLALGAAGSFVESLGAAGYDAANAERRIPSLASLHDIGVVFGPIAFVAVPVGVVTCLVLVTVRAAHRLRTSR